MMRASVRPLVGDVTEQGRAQHVEGNRDCAQLDVSRQVRAVLWRKDAQDVIQAFDRAQCVPPDVELVRRSLRYVVQGGSLWDDHLEDAKLVQRRQSGCRTWTAQDLKQLVSDALGGYRRQPIRVRFDILPGVGFDHQAVRDAGPYGSQCPDWIVWDRVQGCIGAGASLRGHPSRPADR